MMTVKEVSRISGVSVRTLHHYDAIGLLRPTAVTDAGYRLYDDEALSRLQSILLFRQLQFPLKEIRRIMDAPGFDRIAALKDQRELLRLQKERLERLIALACDMMGEEGTTMDFSAFDQREIDRYAEEAKARWGHTAAWKEYAARAEDGRSAAEGLMAVFQKFGEIRQSDPSGEAAAELVKELQQYITDHYYTCTPEILASLGEMYASDPRFAGNIDAAAGGGTADFVARAIRAYGL